MIHDIGAEQELEAGVALEAAELEVDVGPAAGPAHRQVLHVGPGDAGLDQLDASEYGSSQGVSTPEPSSVTLAVLGFLGLWHFARRV